MRSCWCNISRKVTSVAVTLQPELSHSAEVAAVPALQFGPTTGQSELAARLEAGLSLLNAARAMGISRHTANEHQVALTRRAGAADRKALMALLQRALQR